MKMIIGLGNPTKEFYNTRHNIGFLCIDYLVKKLNLTNPKNEFNAKIWKYWINNEFYLFVKPMSYMNLSGTPIICLITYYKINIEDIIIIQDDKDLKLNDLKIKIASSAGGHNGIKDILQKLKTKKIKRIKIGIGFNSNYSIKDWVLSSFNSEEFKKLELVFERIYIFLKQYFKGIDFENIISLKKF